MTAERIIAHAPQELHFELLPSRSGYTIDTFYAAHEAGEHLGGDWYDIFRLPDGRIVITIGDVEGCDWVATCTMQAMRQVMRTVGLVHPVPNAMLSAADVALRACQPDMLATALAGVFDPCKRTFTFACAGHPPPLLLHAGGLFEEPRCTGLPLGLRTGDEPSAISIELLPGMMMVLYTDGLVESTRCLDEGMRRLQEVLQDHTIRSLRRFAHAIYRRVLFDGVFDDVAIVTMRIESAVDLPWLR